MHGRERQRRVALRELSQLLRERAFELSRMIRLKIIEAGIENPSSANVVLTGGSSKLVGMEDLFKQHLSPNVRVAGPERSLDLPEELRGPEFSTSVGLLRWAIRQPDACVAVAEPVMTPVVEPTERSGRSGLFSRIFQFQR